MYFSTPEQAHTFYIGYARLISMLGTCDRANVGAVILKEGMVLGKGFNTSATGLPNCRDVGHLMIEGHCCRTIHAEHNAILDALSNKREIVGATMYVTHEPCVHCRKLIVQMGVGEVIYAEPYRSSITEISGDVKWVHYDTLQKTL